jgi:hypothetical protein
LPGFDHNGFQTTHTAPNGYHSLAGNYGSVTQNEGRVQHKILLPKPPALTPDNSPDRYQSLRIDTSPNGMPTNPVDADRLHAIYNNHRSTFWSAIAQEYGSDLSPGQLEDIWRHNTNMPRRPPTPGDSPNSRAVHNILKPSPFPNFSSFDHHKDYSSVNHVLHSMSPPDRLPYPMGVTDNTYNPMPSLPRLDRQWTNPTAPPTAISTLLNDEKCPRHNEYCVGGRCFH